MIDTIDKLIAALNKDKIMFEKFEKIRPTLKPDLSDLGNTVGFIIGTAIKEREGEKDFNKEEFLRGFKHGISLTDGTH